MDIYLSESRISADEEEILELENIKPGGKSICHASVQLVSQQHGIIKTAKAKLDSCGSVSIAHGNLLNQIKPSKHYKLPNVRLRGIGSKTNMLKEVDKLKEQEMQTARSYQNRQGEARFLWIGLHRSRQPFTPHQTIKPLQITER
jgi:hypothetical protein